jgi:hypothetical protein
MKPNPRIGARRKRHVFGAVMAVLLLWAQPALVLANVYSAQVWEWNLTPIGEPNTDYCARAGMVDSARNYGQVLAYTNGGGSHDCLGATNSLPAGWIGIKVEGFRDGGLCGTSSYYFSSQAASNWQLWITLCSNPAGNQNFQSRSFINIYTGAGYTGGITGPFSPVAQY